MITALPLFLSFCPHLIINPASLHKAGCFSNYFYDRNNKTINFAVHQKGDLQQFLTGSWFEIFVFDRISKFLSDEEINYESLVNAKIIFSNGDRYELDLLFLVEGQLFWIECKAGSNLSSIDSRFSQYSDKNLRFLQLPQKNAVVVCLHLDREQAASRTDL